jgi:hypothetical protein
MNINAKRMIKPVNGTNEGPNVVCVVRFPKAMFKQLAIDAHNKQMDLAPYIREIVDFYYKHNNASNN